MPDTYSSFVTGYLILWLIPFLGLAFLIAKIRKWEKQDRGH